jgi:Ca2+-binding EF-hand superfamily protein
LFYDDAWEIFQTVDTSGDQSIDREEFARMDSAMLGIVNNPFATFDIAFDEIDLDSTGTIDLREFCIWLGKQHFKTENEQRDIIRAYNNAAGWFGKTDDEIMEMVAHKDAVLVANILVANSFNSTTSVSTNNRRVADDRKADAAVAAATNAAVVKAVTAAVVGSNNLSTDHFVDEAELAAQSRRIVLETLGKPGKKGVAARAAVFQTLDANNDGTVTRKEALAAIAALWEDLDNMSACMMAYEAADRNGNGLELRETRLFFQYQLHYNDCVKTFRQADVDGDGQIDQHEFVNLGIDSYSTAKETFAMIDLDNSGTIDLREFATWMGTQQFDSDDELDDIMRAYKESASWFGKPDNELMEVVAQKEVLARRAKFEALMKPGNTGRLLRAEAFKVVDANNDGVVSRAEAMEAIAALWEDFDNLSACMMAYEAADRNGTGLTWRETRLFFQYQLFYDDAWEVFQHVDVDHDGDIDRDEFALMDPVVLRIAFNPFASFDSAFDEIDLDNSGTINLREFCTWLGMQHFSSELEIADVQRAYNASESWFGMKDDDLIALATEKDNVSLGNPMKRQQSFEPELADVDVVARQTSPVFISKGKQPRRSSSLLNKWDQDSYSPRQHELDQQSLIMERMTPVEWTPPVPWTPPVKDWAAVSGSDRTIGFGAKEEEGRVQKLVQAIEVAKLREQEAGAASPASPAPALPPASTRGSRRASIELLAKAGKEGHASREAAFKSIDINSDGVVTRKEALEAIAAMWDEFDNLSACMMAYEAADRNGGGLSWRETRLFFQYQLFYDDAWELFQQVDMSGDGRIDRHEFANIDSAMLGIKSNPFATFDDAFDEIDVDNSGTIDLREFCTWLGRQQYETEAELADIERAYQESDSWFGKSDIAVMKYALQKDRAADGAVRMSATTAVVAAAAPVTGSVVVRLTATAVAGMIELFKALDADGNGALTASDFGAFGSDPDFGAQGWSRLQSQFDLDGDGSVSVDEFCSVLKELALDKVANSPVGFSAPSRWVLTQWCNELTEVLSAAVEQECNLLRGWCEQYDGVKSALRGISTVDDRAQYHIGFEFELGSESETQISTLFRTFDQRSAGAIDAADFGTMSKNSSTAEFWREVKFNFDGESSIELSATDFRNRVACAVSNRAAVGLQQEAATLWGQVIEELEAWNDWRVQTLCAALYDIWFHGEYGQEVDETSRQIAASLGPKAGLPFNVQPGGSVPGTPVRAYGGRQAVASPHLDTITKLEAKLVRMEADHKQKIRQMRQQVLSTLVDGFTQ